MNNLIKTLLISLCYVMVSCSTPTGNGIAAGTKVQVKYITDFYPKQQLGMKYVYLSSEKKGLAQTLTRLEYSVTEINDNKVKLKTLANGIDQKSLDIDINKPPLLPSANLQYEGEDFLIVTAGSYQTTRFSYLINNDRYDLWLSKDVGVIKFSERKSSGDVVITELNEFRI